MALVPQVVDAVKVPVIASGGIMDGRGIAAALALGASAVQMGTAFLTCDEAGIPDAYKQAILTTREHQTRVTRAFSGRHARGIVNRFMSEMESGRSGSSGAVANAGIHERANTGVDVNADVNANAGASAGDNESGSGSSNTNADAGTAISAILPFPLQNTLTRELRNAAGARGRTEFLSLWAGQGVRMARRQKAADLVARLAEETSAAIHRLRDVEIDSDRPSHDNAHANASVDVDFE